VGEDQACRFAVLYDTGEGVLQDRAEAAKFYGVCAQSGDAPAMVRLAQLYEAGEGVPSNSETALAWYRKAADADQSDAQCRLATLYETGQGVEQDPSEAIKWYRSCAESGSGSAMFRLAKFFDNADEPDNDPKGAANYMFRALKRTSSRPKMKCWQGPKPGARRFVRNSKTSCRLKTFIRVRLMAFSAPAHGKPFRSSPAIVRTR
jgi:TPR repeat protein